MSPRTKLTREAELERLTLLRRYDAADNPEELASIRAAIEKLDFEPFFGPRDARRVGTQRALEAFFRARQTRARA